jgi:hypothetical protein
MVFDSLSSAELFELARLVREMEPARAHSGLDDEALGELAEILGRDETPSVGWWTHHLPRTPHHHLGAVARLAEDPDHLIGVVREMRRFSTDVDAIASGALELAETVGIDLDQAQDLIIRALTSPDEGRRHGRPA